jgi:hypothetical protein
MKTPSPGTPAWGRTYEIVGARQLSTRKERLLVAEALLLLRFTRMVPVVAFDGTVTVRLVAVAAVAAIPFAPVNVTVF